jgi:hypothetical protein
MSCGQKTGKTGKSQYLVVVSDPVSRNPGQDRSAFLGSSTKWQSVRREAHQRHGRRQQIKSGRPPIAAQRRSVSRWRLERLINGCRVCSPQPFRKLTQTDLEIRLYLRVTRKSCFNPKLRRFRSGIYFKDSRESRLLRSIWQDYRIWIMELVYYSSPPLFASDRQSCIIYRHI